MRVKSCYFENTDDVLSKRIETQIQETEEKADKKRTEVHT